MSRIIFYIIVYLILIISAITQVILFSTYSKKAAIAVLIYELVVITAYTVALIIFIF